MLMRIKVIQITRRAPNKQRDLKLFIVGKEASPKTVPYGTVFGDGRPRILYDQCSAVTPHYDG